MLQWTDQFATGFPLVDTQHRMLIDKINLLERIAAEPKPQKAQVDELLTFLGGYVATHFKFEEGCMEKARCPAHEKNKQAHAAFLNTFAKCKAQYGVEGPTPAFLRGLHQAAADWIKGHILSVDVQLKSCKAA